MAKAKSPARSKSPPKSAKSSAKSTPRKQQKKTKQRRKSPWREIRLVLIVLIWLSIPLAGFIAYVAIKILSGKFRDSSPAMVLIAAAFVTKFWIG